MWCQELGPRERSRLAALSGSQFESPWFYWGDDYLDFSLKMLNKKLTYSKKLKKLVRHPISFFRDFAKKRLPQKNFGNISYSLVIAYTNAENVKRCIESVCSQTVLPGREVEIILLPIGDDVRLVNSLDSYGYSILEIKTRFSSVAVAYNFAIGIAKNEFIKFTDDEAILDKDFFTNIEKVVGSSKIFPIVLLNSVSFLSDRGLPYSDPITATTISGNKIVNTDKVHTPIGLSLRSTSFALEIIKSAHIKFDKEIIEQLAGADFCSKYFSYAVLSHLEVAHIKSASLLFMSTTHWEKDLALNLENPRFGKAYLDIISTYFKQPQNSVLANTHFNFLLNLIDSAIKKRKIDEKMEGAEKKYIIERVIHLLNSFGEEYIKKYTGLNFKFFHRVGLLNLANFTPQNFQIAYIEDYDPHQRRIKIKYYADAVRSENFLLNGISVIPSNVKSRHHSILGFQFCDERIFWIYANSRPNATIKIELGGYQKVRISLANRNSDDCRLGDIVQHFNDKNKSSLPLPLKVGVLRSLSRFFIVQKKFKNAWLVTDNDIKADDNGEHFYRYLMKSQPQTLAYFLINKNTVEWQRLKREGFKLIPFGGLRHRLALLSCRYLISSHANPAIVNFLPKKHFADLMTYDFIFLQHGVTKDDQSEWLNSRDIRLLVTAAVPEYKDISGDGRYKYTDREVMLTGFPRHDSLVNAAPSDKLILIMPTWRKSLSGSLMKKSSKREKNPLFKESLFCKHWTALISSPRLKDYCDLHGYKIAFFPHPNIMDYMEDMHLPDYIESYSNGDSSIQELFQRAAMIVTDFSSVAFELAYMHKPAVYFQFDIDEFFAEHSYTRGYYDYEADGFGPVCYSEESAIEEIGKLLTNDCVPPVEYLNRMDNFFPYRDGKCSERTYLQIKALDQSYDSNKFNPAILLEFARTASLEKKWRLAIDRWQLIYDINTGEQKLDAAFHLAQAKRHIGTFQEVPGLLKLCRDAWGNRNEIILLEEAELASATADWPTAATAWQHIASGRLICPIDYILLKLVEAYRRQGETTLAFLALSRYPVEIKNTVEYRIEHAYLQSLSANWEAAAEEWSSLIDEQSSGLPVDALFRLAEAQQKLNLLDSAHIIFTSLLKKSPNDVVFLSKMASIEFERGKWAAAEKHWLVLEKFPTYQFSFEDAMQLAVSQVNMGKLDKAESRFLNMVESHSDNSRSAVELVKLYYHQQCWNKLIKTAHGIDPVLLETGQFRLMLATSYLEIGQFDDAYHELVCFAKTNPKNVEADILRARLAYATRDWNTASTLWIYLIDNHREMLPANASLLLVKALQKQGLLHEAQKALYKEAEYVCHTALEQDPSNIKNLYEYAEVIGKLMLTKESSSNHHESNEFATIYANQ